jgi:23S rRNA (cytosine1962-C5)-methyltransferase
MKDLKYYGKIYKKAKEKYMSEAIVTLKKGEGRSLKSGGLWVYDNEIDTIMGTFKNGDVVVVRDFDGYMLGRGYINQNSKIRIRMMTRDKEQLIDRDFLKKRVREAWEYRKKTVDISSCRIIFGEADFLPGIVIDKFSDVLVVESLALGIDKMKLDIIDCLKEVLAEDGIKIRGVYERSDAKVRLQEGMERFKGFVGDEFDTEVEIIENGVKYMVDVKDGQKTGFFLDQKYNRLAIQKLCKGARVLDCFTHTGSFALNAGIAGAKSVLGVDASELAVEQATKNANLNGLQDIVKFQCADVFDLLPRLEEQGEKFDVVILDPPAFTKSRNSVKNATKGYREINMRGMKLVRDGGFLATCSCSHFMEYEMFTQIISQAAKSVHCRLRQVEYRTQSSDHPILWNADESYYLKFYIFQVRWEK